MNIKPKYVKGDIVFYIEEQTFYPMTTYKVIEGIVLGFNYNSNSKPHFSYLINSQPKNANKQRISDYSRTKKGTELFNSKKEATSEIPATPIALIKQHIGIVEEKTKENKDRNKRNMTFLKKLLKKRIKNEKISNRLETSQKII